MSQTQSDTPATDHATEDLPERSVHDILQTILAVVRDVSDPDRNLKMEKYCAELEAAVDRHKLVPAPAGSEAGRSDPPHRTTDADEASHSQTHSRAVQQSQSSQTTKR